MQASTMNASKLAAHLSAITDRIWKFVPSDDPQCEDDSVDLPGTGWHIQVCEDGELWLNFVNDCDKDWWMRTYAVCRSSTDLLNLALRDFHRKTDAQLHELGHCGEYTK